MRGIILPSLNLFSLAYTAFQPEYPDPPFINSFKEVLSHEYGSRSLTLAIRN